jgi:hypothetical protein
MAVSHWTKAESDRAQQIWSEYQRHHDLSDKAGQTAGIDPVRGCIWFGDSIQDVIAQRDADGSEAPLFFMRVGSRTYYRKGGLSTATRSSSARGCCGIIGSGLISLPGP